MTPDDPNDALDAMELAAVAAGNPEIKAGLITVESGHWMNVLSEVRATCATLHDVMRHRDIKIASHRSLRPSCSHAPRLGSSANRIAIWRHIHETNKPTLRRGRAVRAA